jgi:hypothetical protein
MSPTFLRLIGGAIFGMMALSLNPLQAEASQLKSTPNICNKNPLLQSAFFKQIEEICQKAEKPVPKTNNSDQDTDNSSDKDAPDKSTEEAEPTTPNDSHDFNLIKGNIIFQLSPGGGSGDSFGNGFTSPEPMQPEPIQVKPPKKAPKKIKLAKPQKLVSPALNRNQLLPRQIIKPIIPKTPANIKSLIVPNKTIRPILSRPNRTLRIRSVQPMMRQNPMINRSISRPVPVKHRSK